MAVNKLANYREPNVYTKVQRMQPRVPQTVVDMYPLVIGTGAEDYAYQTFKKDVEVTSSTLKIGLEEVTKSDNVINVSVVNSTGATVELNGDPTYNDTNNCWEITLKAAPESSTTYTVEYSITNPDQYKLQRFTSATAVEEFYGGVYLNDAVNKISLGAKIALDSGSPVVYVLQVKKPDSSGSLKESYMASLEENAVEVSGNPIWRVQPVDDDKELREEIMKFVKDESAMEERNEKFVGLNNSDAADCVTVADVQSSFETFIEKYTTNPTNYDKYRAQTCYPNKAIYTVTNSDGEEQDITLGGEFILIAMAGMEQSLERVSQSMTCSSIPAGIFKSLVGVKMKRKQKNDLAAIGVTLLVQNTEGGAIEIRDSLSIDVSSEQTSDPSITRAIDYGAKYVRAQLHPYLGKYDIDEEILSKIEASASIAYDTLVQRRIYKSAVLNEVYQNEDNLNNVIVNARVGVRYPLKTIDVNVVCE